VTTPEAANAHADSGPLVLGIDLGTSAVKVALCGLDASVLASGSAAFPTVCDEIDQAEQNPADWLNALRLAAAELDRTLLEPGCRWRERVAAVGLTGQLPTLVCLGAQGPIGRAITWKDARADAATLAMLDAARRRALYEQTGMPVDGRYLGPMFRHHWASRRDEIECILSAKDYLTCALTGSRVTDPSTAAGYGAYDLQRQDFSPELCELWQMPRAAMPAVRPSHSVAGFLNRFGATLLGLREGIPVNAGAADSVSSALAMAGPVEGIACVTMGSSTVIIDAVRDRRLDPRSRYLLTPHAEPGWFGREMDLLATGTGHRWLSDLLGFADGMLDLRAADSEPGARGILFSPYLAGGEQGALWDPALRAAISGLTLRHTAADLARAFLEGVGFEIRRCLDVLAETLPPRAVVVAGHIVQHPSSLRMLTDILNRPVQPYPTGSPAALGAALHACRLISASSRARGNQSGWPAELRPGKNADIYNRVYAQYLAQTRVQGSTDATPVV
jgi:xylulokinase